MTARQVNFLEDPAEFEHEQAATVIRSPKRSLFFVAIFGSLLLLLGGYIGYRALRAEAPQDPEAYDPITLEPKKPEGIFKRLGYVFFGPDTSLAGAKDDRVNILLLGMGGIGHEGPFLTDTIMIVSMKPTTNQIALISIPRDLGVEMPNHGWQKINQANSYGETEKTGWGGAYATEIIERTFDMDIPYYVRVDFAAFKEMIDEVGGVSVNVERGFTDPLYPTGDFDYQTLTFAAGAQTMDGERALEFARSRHGSNGEGSDFARARRQQKVMLALKEKVFSFGTLVNPVRVNNIMKSLDTHMTTNMEFPEMMEMLKIGRGLDTSAVVRLVLDSSPNGYLVNGAAEDGAFILRPKSGTFKEIRGAMENIFEENLLASNDTPAQTAPPSPNVSIEIQNGTWNAGLAARVKKRLDDSGFATAAIGNTSERPQPTSSIFVVADKKFQDVATSLQNELRMPVKQTMPNGIAASTSTDILVVLGEDFSE